jgi:hypothetical protein
MQCNAGNCQHFITRDGIQIESWTMENAVSYLSHVEHRTNEH